VKEKIKNDGFFAAAQVDLAAQYASREELESKNANQSTLDKCTQFARIPSILASKDQINPKTL
jgi:hypothetical protein